MQPIYEPGQKSQLEPSNITGLGSSLIGGLGHESQPPPKCTHLTFCIVFAICITFH